MLFFTLALLPLLHAFPGAFPPTPEGLTSIFSPTDSGVTSICETTPGVKSYSGYVHLPPNASEARPFDMNLFFWFFEARNSPQAAPLTLWLQGGPGVPSITAALGENGPCTVLSNSKDTALNPWSWNEYSNMLYVDQPVQVGFSYDRLINGTIDELITPFTVFPQNFSSTPESNSTLISGTFASQDNSATTNTTEIASLAMWHFMQTWLSEFPTYKPPNDKFNIWSESYGGHYAPTYANVFENKQGPVPLGIDTVGLVNACIDILVQQPQYPQMAFNNTYGLKLINQTEFDFAVQSFPQCKNMTMTCRAAVDVCKGTPCDTAEADKACEDANTFCFGTMWAAYNKAGRNVFDIAHLLPDAFPPKFAAGFLNTAEVQQDLGVPLNFTGESSAVNNSFTFTGDFVRGGNLEAIGSLLDKGVKVALVYGDRDYQCNWLGGEQISLAINSSFSKSFHTAGYTNITTNSSYVGGVVRQFGNLSFSRVFEAGHEVPWYQPETAFRIFQRATSGMDVATGQVSTSSKNYTTKGPSSVFNIKNTAPEPPKPTCYLWDILETCTPDQAHAIKAGTAIVQDFIFMGLANQSMSNGSGTSSAPSSNISATTSTTSGAGGADCLRIASSIWLGVVVSFLCIMALN